VTTFVNGSEQRQATQPPIIDLVLPMKSLLNADQSAYNSFFMGQVGRFGQNITATINGVTYNDLTLLSDKLWLTRNMAALYDLDVRLRQTANSGWTPPSAGTVFPVLSFGSSFEYPVATTVGLMTGVSDNDHGERFAYEYFGAGIPGFPSSSSGLPRYNLTYPLLSDADITTLYNFFMSQQGRYASFSFTDPSGSTLTHTRFDQDTITIKAITVNQWSTSISLRVTNGS